MALYKLKVISFFLNNRKQRTFFLNSHMKSLFCYNVDWRIPSRQVEVAFYFSHLISLMIGDVNL